MDKVIRCLKRRYKKNVQYASVEFKTSPEIRLRLRHGESRIRVYEVRRRWARGTRKYRVTGSGRYRSLPATGCRQHPVCGRLTDRETIEFYVLNVSEQRGRGRGASAKKKQNRARAIFTGES